MGLRGFVLVLISVFIFGCSADSDEYIDEPNVSPVNLDLSAVPYEELSEYNFFDGEISDLEPVYGVLPYELITPLFSDYSLKKRFIWMPGNQKSTYVSDAEIFNFPTGTVIIKNFYYNNVLPDNRTVIIESRLLIKNESNWIFANYVWNDDQTEAHLDNNGSFYPIEWRENGAVKSANYRIPSSAECLMCHKNNALAAPLGTKPQNINSIFNYADGNSNQLQKWEEMGYLDSNYPSSINTIVKWDDPSQSLDKRVRSYFEVNCAHCHTTGGHCDYRNLRLGFDFTTEPDNMGVCREPEQDISFWLQTQNPSHIIKPDDPLNSSLYIRMNTNEDAIMMPMRGRSVIHTEAVDLLNLWIESLSQNCN